MLTVAGGASAASPPAGPAAKGPVRIVALKPLVLRVTGVRAGTALIVGLTPSGGRRRLILPAGGSGLLRVGVDATSCTKPIVSVTVLTTAGRRIGSVRIPVRDCAPRD